MSTLTPTRPVEQPTPITGSQPTKPGAPKWMRLLTYVGCALAGLCVLGYNTDAHTVLAYEVNYRLNEPDVPPVCTPTTWIVVPHVGEAGPDIDYSITVTTDPCWSVTRDNRLAPEDEVGPRFEALASSDAWTVVEAAERRSLLVTTDLNEDELKAEVARLTGTPEYGAYLSWYQDYGPGKDEGGAGQV